jgi:hypothetical protein
MVAHYANHIDFDSNRGLDDLQREARRMEDCFLDEPNYCFVLYDMFKLMKFNDMPQDLSDEQHPFNKYANDIDQEEELIEKLRTDLMEKYANSDPLFHRIIRSFFDPNGENRDLLEEFMWDYWTYANKALNLYQDEDSQDE